MWHGIHLPCHIDCLASAAVLYICGTLLTVMNAESSRSHLVIGIVIETANRVSGQILKGKVGALGGWVWNPTHNGLFYIPELFEF